MNNLTNDFFVGNFVFIKVSEIEEHVQKYTYTNLLVLNLTREST